MSDPNNSGVARLPEVEDLTGLSRSSIYRLESLNLFPPRLKLGPRAVGWSRESIERWCKSRTAVRPEQGA